MFETSETPEASEASGTSRTPEASEASGTSRTSEASGTSGTSCPPETSETSQTSETSETSETSPVVPKLGPRFREALSFAALLHANQLRKGTDIPYVAHLLAVASLALEHGADEDTAIAALLHDAVEDQGGKATLERIRQAFGERVAAIVNGCSDTDETPKPPWHERKKRYLTHLPTASPEARLVSACDKLHNARCLLEDYRRRGEEIWSRFRGGREGTLWYYRELLAIFRQVGSPVLDELERVVNELERLSSAQATG